MKNEMTRNLLPLRWIDAHRWAALLALVVFALGVRSSVMIWRMDGLDADPDAYRLLAENLANTGVLGQVDASGHARPTAFRPPGYPVLLSLLVHDGKLASRSVAVLHVIVGLLSVITAFLIGNRLFRPALGIVAGCLIAIDPILLGQSSLVMTETLACFLATVAWYFIVRVSALDDPASALSSDSPSAQAGSSRGDRQSTGAAGWTLPVAMLLGVSMSAGFLCRPIFIVWFALSVPVWMIAWRRKAILPLGIVAMMLGATIGVWTMRNHTQLHHNIWATTHGGYTLLLANNPPFYRYLAGQDTTARSDQQWGQKWDATFFHARWARRLDGDPRSQAFWDESTVLTTNRDGEPLPEVQDDRLAYESAKATIERQPKMFAYSCLVRLGRLWSLAPHAGDVSTRLRMAIFAFYAATALLVLGGIVRLGRRLLQPVWLSALALMLAISCVHSVYWSNMRMRAPATCMIVMLAAVGIAGPRQAECVPRN